MLQLRALLADLISTPTPNAHELMSMFSRNVVNDLRMLRNALAIRKVKVWLADKRAFFYKNDIDEHVGEGGYHNLFCCVAEITLRTKPCADALEVRIIVSCRARTTPCADASC